MHPIFPAVNKKLQAGIRTFGARHQRRRKLKEKGRDALIEHLSISNPWQKTRVFGRSRISDFPNTHSDMFAAALLMPTVCGGIVYALVNDAYEAFEHFGFIQFLTSIIIGIVTYIWVVVPMKGYSAIAGSVALFIMMLPLIIRSTEETLKILPVSLKESALALGAGRARAMLKVQLPAALGGIFTGVLLATSRVIGETAPLMFTALGCSFMRYEIDKPISAVPLLIWEFFNDPNLQELIWGASLFLLLFVLTLNLTAKHIAKKWKQ